MMSIHNVTDVRLVVSEARSAKRTSVAIAFTKYDAPNCLSAIGLPQLYFVELCIMRGHLDNMVLAVVHKAITGPKFNRRTLQKQLALKEWLTAECIQLYSNAKQNMFDTPCIAHIDASILFWVWLYSIKPHENDRKKVRGVCDRYTRGSKTMVHDATYAPHHNICICLQISLSALLGMCL
jgi:hypothetical protein